MARETSRASSLRALAAAALLPCLGCQSIGLPEDLEPIEPAPGQLTIDMAYPPVKLDEMGSTGLSGVEFTLWHLDRLGSRNVRIDADWNRMGGDGPIDWAYTRRVLEPFHESGRGVVVTVRAAGPDSACGFTDGDLCVFDDHEAFAEYVRGYVTELGDYIHWIQFSNEMLSEDFYPGTPSEYVASQRVFAATVRELRPDLEVAIGGFSTGTLRRFAACARGKTFTLRHRDLVLTTREELDAWCEAEWIREENAGVLEILETADYDIVDLHLYADPESWPLLLEAIREVVPGDPRYVVTELGGPHRSDPDASDVEHQGREVERYVRAVAAMDVDEAYFFKLIERGDGSSHAHSGLIDPGDGDPKPGYFVIRDFNQGRL